LIERLIKHQLRSVLAPLTVHKVGDTDENETCQWSVDLISSSQKGNNGYGYFLKTY